MARGTVKWFSNSRGYGFIETEGHSEVFVHHSAIEGGPYRTLREGEEVEFETRESERGIEATHVVRV